jgi:hypothetical protein
VFNVLSVRRVDIILHAALNCVILCGLGFRERGEAVAAEAEGTMTMSEPLP